MQLIVAEDVTDIDALKYAQSLPAYSGEIKGIVPLFGGKCFDITLTTEEAAVKLAQEGFDYENSHKPLRFLGQRIHVSIFVSVKFPDKDLLTLLATYSELKLNTVRRLHFNEEGFIHIESGIHVVQFNEIKRDIPKCVILGGLEIGFKYSGQPVTCHRCHSMEHMVKNCPKKRVLQKNRPETTEETPQAENNRSEQQDMDTAPGLFTQPDPSSYAAAALNRSDIPESNIIAQQLRQWNFLSKTAGAAEAMERPEASHGCKCDVPSPSTSDDEHRAPPKSF